MLEWAPNPDPVGTSPAHRLLACWWNNFSFCFKECFKTHIFVLEKWSAFLMSWSSFFRYLVSMKNIFLHYNFSPHTRSVGHLQYHLLHLKEEWEEQRDTLSVVINPELFWKKAGSVRRPWAVGIVRTAVSAGSPAGDTVQCLRFATLTPKWIHLLDMSHSICIYVH